MEASELTSRKAWAYHRGEWQEIEDPLAQIKPSIPDFPQDPKERKQKYAEWRKQRSERFRNGGYSPYAWLSLDPSEKWPMLTVSVHTAKEELPHKFVVILGKEGTDFYIYLSDLPSLLQLLRELAPIAAWDVATEVERARQDTLRNDENE